MAPLSSELTKMSTHHGIMTSLSPFFLVRNFSFSTITQPFYNSRTDIFRDVIPFIINHCDPRRPKGGLRRT